MMSAVSTATSVPAPMAMPTSAWARAGASLTPSPVIATTEPSDWTSLIFLRLLIGQDLGEVIVQAELVGHPVGHLPVVAGEHHAADAHLP